MGFWADYDPRSGVVFDEVDEYLAGVGGGGGSTIVEEETRPYITTRGGVQVGINPFTGEVLWTGSPTGTGGGGAPKGFSRAALDADVAAGNAIIVGTVAGMPVYQTVLGNGTVAQYQPNPDGTYDVYYKSGSTAQKVGLSGAGGLGQPTAGQPMIDPLANTNRKLNLASTLGTVSGKPSQFFRNVQDFSVAAPTTAGFVGGTEQAYFNPLNEFGTGQYQLPTAAGTATITPTQAITPAGTIDYMDVLRNYGRAPATGAGASAANAATAIELMAQRQNLFDQGILPLDARDILTQTLSQPTKLSSALVGFKGGGKAIIRRPAMLVDVMSRKPMAMIGERRMGNGWQPEEMEIKPLDPLADRGRYMGMRGFARGTRGGSINVSAYTSKPSPVELTPPAATTFNPSGQQYLLPEPRPFPPETRPPQAAPAPPPPAPVEQSQADYYQQQVGGGGTGFNVYQNFAENQAQQQAAQQAAAQEALPAQVAADALAQAAQQRALSSDAYKYDIAGLPRPSAVDVALGAASPDLPAGFYASYPDIAGSITSLQNQLLIETDPARQQAVQEQINNLGRFLSANIGEIGVDSNRRGDGFERGDGGGEPDGGGEVETGFRPSNVAAAVSFSAPPRIGEATEGIDPLALYTAQKFGYRPATAGRGRRRAA